MYSGLRLQPFRFVFLTSSRSHLISVPPGPHILSDALVSSPLFFSDEVGGASAEGAAAAGGGIYPPGFDPNLDPELAEVLLVLRFM